MKSKKQQQRIGDVLSKALEAPKRRPSPALDQKLAEFLPAPGAMAGGVPPIGMPQQGIPSRGIPQDGMPERGMPPESTPAPASLVSEAGGFYATFNDISDRLIPTLKLDAYEQTIFYRLYRLSHGRQRETCVVGLTTLARHTNLSRSTAQKTIKRLIERALIEHVAEHGQAGTEYRVLPGVAIPPDGIPPDGMPS